MVNMPEHIILFVLHVHIMLTVMSIARIHEPCELIHYHDMLLHCLLILSMCLVVYRMDDSRVHGTQVVMCTLMVTYSFQLMQMVRVMILLPSWKISKTLIGVQSKCILFSMEIGVAHGQDRYMSIRQIRNPFNHLSLYTC